MSPITGSCVRVSASLLPMLRWVLPITTESFRRARIFSNFSCVGSIRIAGSDWDAAFVESLEHLAPAALLCVIRVQDLEPTARRAVGSSGSLQDDTLKVLRAANPEQFDGCA